ncbi:aldo/keto reductase [Nonomuraea fuscirosea]|uniref:aldo/keto reductase n=1 Tax=Nonomuraea fuscirosea TaxID=1291556 RepID=UPI00343474F4
MLTKRPLGSTGLLAPPLCIGTSAIGSIPGIYGYEVDRDQALRTLRAVFDGPIRFLDTSNGYGGGESERRIGAVLREIGGVPADFLLSTKVDPDASGDFSGERVRASLAESMERLGMDHLPLVYLHDPERITFDQATAAGGPVEALVQAKEEGLVGHLGVAGGPVDLLRRFVNLGVFEAVITHNRFTLLDRSAEPLLDQCAEAGVAVLNAAPFGGGMLVKGPDTAPRYAYRMASDEVRQSAAGMWRACEQAGVPLAAAALQFSMRDPRIGTTVVGITRPERLAHTLELAALDIPDDLWAELDKLTPPSGTWLR